MANLVDYISGKIRPYTRYIIIVLVLLLFIVVSFYVLNQYSKNKLNESKKFKDVANNGSRQNEIEVMMFHVDWCPHCKKALPEWYPFCDQYNNTNVNGYLIKCSREGNNCTNDNDQQIASMIKEYKIESYPTVIIVKDDKRYDFDAKITKSALEQFVQSVTSE